MSYPRTQEYTGPFFPAPDLHRRLRILWRSFRRDSDVLPTLHRSLSKSSNQVHHASSVKGLLEGCHRPCQKQELTFFVTCRPASSRKKGKHHSCMTVSCSSVGKSTGARHCKGDWYNFDVLGRVTRIDSKRAYGGRCSF